MSTHKKYYNNGSRPSGYTPQNATPKKKQDKKDLTYWLVVIALAFTFIGSILGTVSFAKGCIEDYQQKNALSSIHSVEDIAKYKSEKPFINSAFDTVTEEYTYFGNNFFVPTTSAYPTETDYTYSIYLLSVDVQLSKVSIPKNYSNDRELSFYIPSLMVYMEQRYKPLDITTILGDPNEFLANEDGYVSFANFKNFNFTSNPGSLNGVTREEVNNNTFIYYSPSYFFYGDRATSGYNSFYGSVDYCSQYGFNGNVISIRFYNFKDVMYENTRLINYVEYTDTNGYIARLGFIGVYKNSSVWTGVVAWEDRTYYLSNEFSDNQYYQNGFQQGYQNGKVDGEQIGYQDGYQNGRLDGYNAGYNAGVESGNEFTFLGLFGALFDAPITALQGLLNFNLLGFNMFNFFTALLTIGLIIFIVRLFV